jgi:hypothetical protein
MPRKEGAHSVMLRASVTHATRKGRTSVTVDVFAFDEVVTIGYLSQINQVISGLV